MLSNIIDNIIENYGEVSFLKADGFDDAVIGYEEQSMRLIYSVTKCIEILINQGLSFTDAMEHFKSNVKIITLEKKLLFGVTIIFKL